MTARGTNRPELIAAAEAAALALATQLGLGDETRRSTEWPIDDGDALLAVELGGEVEGHLFLAVNDEVAGRLLANAHVLDAAFEAARARMAESLGASVTSGSAARVAVERPAVVVDVLDDGELTAVAGLTAVVPALDAAEPEAPETHDFEPAPIEPVVVSAVSSSPLSVLNDVDLVVTAELGRTTMPVRELLSLTPGMVVEIDRAAGAPIDLLVNGRRIAAGEVVVIDEEFGIRITEIAPTAERPR